MNNNDFITLDEHFEEIKRNDPERYKQIIELSEEKLRHGGARSGSGRKKVASKKVTVSVVLSPEIIDKIDKKRGKISRSKYINEILSENA